MEDRTRTSDLVALVILDRIAVLVVHRHLDSVIHHLHRDVEGLTLLASLRGKRHNTSGLVNLDLISSNTLRKLLLIQEELSRLKLLFNRRCIRVIKLRLRHRRGANLRILRLIRQVRGGYRKRILRKHRARVVLALVQTRSKRITVLNISRHRQRARLNRRIRIRHHRSTRTYRIAILISPLDEVLKTFTNRQTSRQRLNGLTNTSPIVIGVLLQNIKLQRRRIQRNIPIAIRRRTRRNQCTVATKDLGRRTRIWAIPMTQRPRIQRTNIIRQDIAVLIQNLHIRPVGIDVLRRTVTRSPAALIMRISKRVQLARRRSQATRSALPAIAPQTLPVQTEVTLSIRGGLHRLSNPPLRISRYLLINPTLQTLLIINSPPLATQRLTREILLHMLMDRLDRLIRQVRTNNLQTSSRHIIAVLLRHCRMVQRTLGNTQVPKRITPVVTSKTTALRLSPLILRQVLRQRSLLSVLNRHTLNTITSPLTITLSVRSNQRIREHTSSRLVHQTVLTRQILRQLRPHTNLLTTVIILRNRLTNSSVSCELTLHTLSVGIRCHVQREVTVFIRLGVVHRRSMHRVNTLVPLRIHLHTLQGFTGILHVAETNSGFNDLLDRTGNRALLISLTRRMDRIRIRFNIRSRRLGRRLRSIRILSRLSSRLILLRKRNRLRQRRDQCKRQRSRSNRRATTTCNIILLHRKFLPRK